VLAPTRHREAITAVACAHFGGIRHWSRSERQASWARRLGKSDDLPVVSNGSTWVLVRPGFDVEYGRVERYPEASTSRTDIEVGEGCSDDGVMVDGLVLVRALVRPGL